MSVENRCQRLRFRSWHRGTREMDLLMGSFADAHLSEFTAADLNHYEKILSISDPELYGWITGLEEVPENHKTPVMALLCAHQYRRCSG